MEEKRRRRLNIVDIVVILVIVAAAIFFGWKMTHRSSGTGQPVRKGTIRFVVEVDGIRKDLYDETAALVPCQMAASGSMVDGYILETWGNPCVVERIKAKSPVNMSLEQEILPEEGVDYVNAYYICEVAVDLNDKLNLAGNQEIRLGRSYYLKSIDIEFSGTIISMEKIEG